MNKFLSIKPVVPEERSWRTWPYELQDALLNIQKTASIKKDQIRAERILKARSHFYFRWYLWIFTFFVWTNYYDAIDSARNELFYQKVARCLDCTSYQMTVFLDEVDFIHPQIWDGWFDIFYGTLFVLYAGMFLYTLYWWWQAKRLIKSHEPKRRGLFM